jgi:four helix bundle protein
MDHLLDHERLDVHRVSMEFIRWSGRLVCGKPRIGRNIVDQMTRAADSIPLNIAESNGKRPGPDRSHSLEIARASAVECAAALDVIDARGLRPRGAIAEGKSMIHRIVCMLIKMAPPGS